MKKKRMGDRLIEGNQSPILQEESQDITVSGKLGIGAQGHPVTLVVEDEVTGEVLEINNVQRALLIIEDTRQSGKGWLSMVVGEVEKLNEVLGFLSKITLAGIKKMGGGGKD